LIQVIFFINAALIVGAAVMVVTVRNVIHSALWLITSFFGVGMLIYVGAVSILILFAIMLTRQVTGEGSPPMYERWWIALLVSGLLFAAILFPTIANEQWTTREEVPNQPVLIAGPVEIGTAFMQEYMLPFQLAAVLLLVALVGAIVIALEERTRRRPVPTLAERWEEQRRQQQEQQQATAPPAQAATDDQDQGSGETGPASV
jgi:NADH-quinone oxidoreductase subunit J